MNPYGQSWVTVARALFAQALAGEPGFKESAKKEPVAAPPPGEVFGFRATLEGDVAGTFTLLADAGLLKAAFWGEGTDQKPGWAELLREAAEAAAGDVLARTGKTCHVRAFDEIASAAAPCIIYELEAASGVWPMYLADATASAVKPVQQPAAPVSEPRRTPVDSADAAPATVSAGIDLLLDVELEATLRFGCREMPLGDILELGPGDVVELDRYVADPVDLVVGDKIVARGEVVLVNGNFGLRVTEVAEPRRRLETIRCLF